MALPAPILGGLCLGRPFPMNLGSQGAKSGSADQVELSA